MQARSEGSVPLPPAPLRMGGIHFAEDSAFIAAGVRDVKQLQERAGLTEQSRLLDWGCGAGRLAVGIRYHFGHVEDYHGVDIQSELVGWAQAHLADEHTRFTLIDVANNRYNPGGAQTREIPAADASIDVFYAYSVLSHMLVDDVAAYARIITRILAPAGRAWVTAFVEGGVQSWQENPVGYGPLIWTGRLHCVRYDRAFFELVLAHAGLAVEDFEYGQETDGQSRYLLKRLDAS